MKQDPAVCIRITFTKPFGLRLSVSSRAAVLQLPQSAVVITVAVEAENMHLPESFLLTSSGTNWTVCVQCKSEVASVRIKITDAKFMLKIYCKHAVSICMSWANPGASNHLSEWKIC